MRYFLKTIDFVWWIGLAALWVALRISHTPLGRFNVTVDVYRAFLLEGIIISSCAVIAIGFLRWIKGKDKVTEKRIFGKRFIWHRKYFGGWIVLTVFWVAIGFLVDLYHGNRPEIIKDSVIGGSLFAMTSILSSFWEGQKKDDNENQL